MRNLDWDVEKIRLLLKAYLDNQSLFLNAGRSEDLERFNEDFLLYLDKQTAGIPHDSYDWTRRVERSHFFQHYPMSQTFVLGRATVEKEHLNFSYTFCYYLKGDGGIVYYVPGSHNERLYLFTGHFFDRLLQRHEEITVKRMDWREARNLAIKEGLEFFSAGWKNPEQDPLLLDIDTRACYQMDGGYAVGSHGTFPIEKNRLPGNQFGEVTVCFFKTFLSDVEIDPEWMNRLVELYRINRVVDKLVHIVE